MRLQATAGNEAVNRLLDVAQAKLTVGPVDDPYDREADAIARQAAALDQQGDPSDAAGPAVRRRTCRSVLSSERLDVARWR